MTDVKYAYSVTSDTLNAKVDLQALEKQIRESDIITALSYTIYSSDVLDIWFKATLSGGDETILDGVVAAHDGEPLYFPDLVAIQSPNGDYEPDDVDVVDVVAGEKKRFAVDAKISNPGDTTLGVMASSKYLKGDYSAVEKDVDSSWATMYEYEGHGKLFNFIQDYDYDKITVRLLVDTEQVFEISLEDLEKLQAEHGNENGGFNFLFNSQGSKLVFFPTYPLQYNTSIKIEAKKTSGGSTKHLDSQIVWLTKEP